jgi:hypothetical protein
MTFFCKIDFEPIGWISKSVQIKDIFIDDKNVKLRFFWK